MIVFDANYTYANFLYNNISNVIGPSYNTYTVTLYASRPYRDTWPVSVPYIGSLESLYFNWKNGVTGHNSVMPGSRVGSYPAIILNSNANITIAGANITNSAYTTNASVVDSPGALLPIAINNGGGWQLL